MKVNSQATNVVERRQLLPEPARDVASQFVERVNGPAADNLPRLLVQQLERPEPLDERQGGAVLPRNAGLEQRRNQLAGVSFRISEAKRPAAEFFVYDG